MFKFLCVLLLIMVNCVLQQVATQYLDVPNIVCPQYFEYLCYGSICIGKITLQNVQLGTTNINVEFSQRNPVQQNNYGSLSLFEDKDTTVEKIKRGESISYRVDFPLSNVLPKLTRLVANNAVLCQDNAYPPPSTTITQQHTLTASVYKTYNTIPYTIYNDPVAPEQHQYVFNTQRPQSRPQHRTKPRPKLKPQTHPQSVFTNSRPREQPSRRHPTVVQQIQSPFIQTRDPYEEHYEERYAERMQNAVSQVPQPNFFQSREPNTQTAVQQIKQPSFISSREPIQEIQQPSFIQPRDPFSQSNQPYCGLEGVTTAIVPFIRGGSILRPGQFPWLTAIYQKSAAGTSFICGGSLISARTILSAAHCFQLTQLTADKIMATLGRYNLSNSMEASVVSRDIQTLLINPEYDPNMFPDADVALLLMSSPVSFTAFIRPICLWGGPEDSSLIINEIGYVAGWGGDEQGNAISQVPKKAPASIVSESVCRQSSDLLKILTTSRTICAGQQDGVGPCMGDSGGGLMIQRNGVWQLRGVVSAGHSEKQRCNLRHYVVYCDVAKFSSWVHSYML